jgi:hypothetical protein
MPDWQSDLKMLQRKPPSKNIAQTIINVMSNDTDDRAAAILAGSLVETSLIGPIAIITGNEAEIEKLFWKRSGRWSTFDSRIKEAANLGIVGRQTTSNLEVIRLVRNAFAHSLSESSSQLPKLNARVRR